MYDFTYHRAASLDQAKAAFESADDARYMAGGMTLLPTLKQRLAQPSDVIDLAGVPDMAGVRRDGDAVVIKALTTHAAVAASAEVADAIPALAQLASRIGDAQVRNRGTLGGSIANADPAADYPAAVLGLGATVRTAAREIAESANIKVICCFTSSGTTVAKVARERPRVPIIAMTSLRGTARRLSLTWGVNCVMTGELERFKQAVVNAARAARAQGYAGSEDQIVVTAGVPFNMPGTTNILRVAPCDERLIYSTDPE